MLLSSQKNITKSPILYRYFHPWLGTGIVNTNHANIPFLSVSHRDLQHFCAHRLLNFSLAKRRQLLKITRLRQCPRKAVWNLIQKRKYSCWVGWVNSIIHILPRKCFEIKARKCCFMRSAHRIASVY